MDPQAQQAQTARKIANIVIALAGAVAVLPPIPIFKGWDSTHIALLIMAIAGGAGYINTPRFPKAKPTEEE